VGRFKELATAAPDAATVWLVKGGRAWTWGPGLVEVNPTNEVVGVAFNDDQAERAARVWLSGPCLSVVASAEARTLWCLTGSWLSGPGAERLDIVDVGKVRVVTIFEARGRERFVGVSPLDGLAVTGKPNPEGASTATLSCWEIPELT
jgi:hypothetical protein